MDHISENSSSNALQTSRHKYIANKFEKRIQFDGNKNIMYKQCIRNPQLWKHETQNKDLSNRLYDATSKRNTQSTKRCITNS